MKEQKNFILTAEESNSNFQTHDSLKNNHVMKYILLILTSLFFISVDQLSKLYIFSRIKPSESAEIIPHFLYFIHAKNYGAAFGFLEASPEAFRNIFMLTVPLAVLVLIIYMISSATTQDKHQHWFLSFIFAGALGNYVDRLNHGYVIDFISFRWKNLSFPAFNIADSIIVLGILGLIFCIYKESFSKKRDSHASIP